jgi:hypothetical protein
MGNFNPNITIDSSLVAELIRLRRYSGKYVCNGGSSTRGERDLAESYSRTSANAINQPAYVLTQPIYRPAENMIAVLNRLRFTLHIDIDGADPLNVVSGTVARGLYLYGATGPAHFIGRVTSNTSTATGRDLVVADFSFTWPGGASVIDRLEISLSRADFFATPTAQVTFLVSGSGTRYGPYSATQQSIYFHEVEVEVDREDGAVDAEPYNPHTHPDRPADLPNESLTLEKCFARAGIRITRSAGTNTINTTAAGGNNRWNYQELHDAMEAHWSAFANKPQWKMWIFLAELADSDTLGGVMFDGDIDEPGGVDRQGTAIFTLCPHFHTSGGAYPQANPPAAAAAKRELFFDLIHETGHAFNLAHSFQKTSVFNPGDAAWSAPSWMPVTNRPQSLSFMNYPDSASPGAGYAAKWFYDQFRFRFDDQENLFLRHAPDSFVQMGNSAWFQHHGRVAEYTLDPRLELTVRTLSPTVEIGEPVNIELKLKNVSQEPVIAHKALDPADGLVEIAVTSPSGERRPFLPMLHTRCAVVPAILEPGKSFYHAVSLTVGRLGCPFKAPGTYRIEASYSNRDGATAAGIMHLHVRPAPDLDTARSASELFNARVGRVLYIGGSRLMEDANDRIDWVQQRLGKKHPAAYFLSSVRALPRHRVYKLVDPESKKLKLGDSDPGYVERTLKPVVENVELASNSLGHILFRAVVDAYTDCAAETGKKAVARNAQSAMLKLFEARGVLPAVLEAVKQRVQAMK